LHASNQEFVNQTSELKRLREEAKDVLRLRAEVARLRQEQAALKRIAARSSRNQQPAKNGRTANPNHGKIYFGSDSKPKGP